MMLFAAESTFASVVADALAIFVLILRFSLFITTASDLFRREFGVNPKEVRAAALCRLPPPPFPDADAYHFRDCLRSFRREDRPTSCRDMDGPCVIVR